VEISDEYLVENILNYGNKEAFIELSKLMGSKIQVVNATLLFFKFLF